jgi:hypothetical protein
MRRFHLKRLEDETGVSGTGIVTEGVEFSDNSCVMRWMTETSSTTVYDSIEDVITIHGHGGKTIVVWQDEPTQDPQYWDKLRFGI